MASVCNRKASLGHAITQRIICYVRIRCRKRIRFALRPIPRFGDYTLIWIAYGFRTIAEFNGRMGVIVTDPGNFPYKTSVSPRPM